MSTIKIEIYEADDRWEKHLITGATERLMVEARQVVKLALHTEGTTINEEKAVPAGELPVARDVEVEVPPEPGDVLKAQDPITIEGGTEDEGIGTGEPA